MRKLKALPNKASTNAISLNLTGLLSNEAPSVALRYDLRAPEWATTQHDAILWLSESAYDVIFDVARTVIAELRGLTSIAKKTSS